MRPGSILLSTASSWSASSGWRRAALPGWSRRSSGPASQAARRWSAAMADTLLNVENVSKRFGGLLAVNKVSFNVAARGITALIGPNGAGKTTLFSIIAGSQAPHRLARRGIARTFQIVQPFVGLTVRENIAIGAHLSRRGRGEALAVAGEVARSVGLGAQLE